MRKLVPIVLLLSILIFILYLISPTSKSSEEIRFVVPLDEDQSTTMKRIGDEKLLRNPALFNLISFFYKIPPKIEPGAYKLKRNMRLTQIAKILQKEPYQKWAMFRPGLRKEQVAEVLSETFKWDQTIKNQFIDLAEEGYLFPDTYLFLPFAEMEQIIGTMTDNFKKKAGDVGKDIVIMASLIEKEVPDSDDRKIVSGILWKRLELGMALQVDAVFPYITGEQKVLLDDLKIDSPYNTYLHKGLPPGPISNPGLDAIEAAKNPKESPYLYYLSGQDSKTHFAKTFSEHLRNKEKYLR